MDASSLARRLPWILGALLSGAALVVFFWPMTRYFYPVGNIHIANETSWNLRDLRVFAVTEWDERCLSEFSELQAGHAVSVGYEAWRWFEVRIEFRAGGTWIVRSNVLYIDKDEVLGNRDRTISITADWLPGFDD